ncbi:cytochrome c oxidase subunit I [Saccharothrix syringae]|uniref:cytochrome c oxidase subunit I n=1 Tax=Saccharothrix syringae TaxID=103733 RepID=UPI000691861D|nr:cbb3-type cytochrome c oxidase subunit I [Saccharothrix syringae]
MTALKPEPVVIRPGAARRRPKGAVLLGLLRTTDPKQIGLLYLCTSFGFFMVGGVMALLIRAELARFILPLQIGSPDVAFPRLNAFSYWLFLFGGLTVLTGFVTPNGAADFGWTAYTPLSSAIHSPGIGVDLWIMGLAVSGLGTILGGVNMVTTVVCLRGPGMTMFRMPVFTWNIFVTSILILLAFPILTAALMGLAADRHLGAHVYDPANGGVILWQHLFWFFGHPEVYIVALPFFGIVTEIFPVFSRKPLFGYKGLVFATFAIAALSVAVWAHHMFATGAVLLPFFSLMTFLIAVPTGIKFFNWIGTMWRGQLTFETPMLFAVGFLVTFLLGGLTGIILASPPLDFHVTDTYFVVAHFHYVLFGTIVFATYAGIYFWFPKMTVLPFVWNVFRSYRFGDPAGADDPWGYGNSLEWATSCPPPRHNFTELPRIRSERPAFELHYPHMVERMRTEAHFSLLTGSPGRHRAASDPATDKALAPTDREVDHDGDG